MLLRLLSAMHQMVPKTAGYVQAAIVPTDDGGGVVRILFHGVDGKLHEVPLGFTQQEIALGTDDAAAAAMERLIAAAMHAVYHSAGEFLTPEQVQSRLVAARQSSPKLLAMDAIAKAARLEDGEGGA